MMGTRTVLLLFYFKCCLGSPTLDFEFPPKDYHFKAETIDLIDQKVSPVEVWKSNRIGFRVDYHHGVEKKFVKRGKNKGVMVHYEADENGDTQLTCTKKSIYSFMSMYQNRLPSIKRFDLSGEKFLNGYRIQIYSTKFEYYESTLYMNGSIPIKLEERSFDEKKGEREHSVTNYFTYETDFDVSDLDPGQFCNGTENKQDNEEVHKDDENYFIQFEKQHDMRQMILKENSRLVEEHNSQNPSYTLTLNQFADLTAEEMMLYTGDTSGDVRLLGTHPFPHTEDEIEDMMDEIPDEWDWRVQGKVSRVKSQSSCGSCWAFAATAAIESAISIKYGPNLDLSEQFFVDCDWPYESYGCQGGFAANGFKLAINHGVPTEEDYGQYMATNGKCHLNDTQRAYKLKGFVAVTPMSANALKASVYKYGPVAVSVFVTPKFHLYSSGIYNEVPEETNTNHGVVVVGYGVRDGVPYWIAKNSWGQRWGQDGYLLIAAHDNAANILLRPFYPIV